MFSNERQERVTLDKRGGGEELRRGNRDQNILCEEKTVSNKGEKITFHKLSMLTHVYNPIRAEEEAGGLGVQDQSVYKLSSTNQASQVFPLTTQQTVPTTGNLMW